MMELTRFMGRHSEETDMFGCLTGTGWAQRRALQPVCDCPWGLRYRLGMETGKCTTLDESFHDEW
jgi:hypothetical protein